ncbi:MAG: hypothetical protein HY716_15485 [Planctomycetes bacterium]|nr:hypothetical protein [Planctomycetota bacterium]
METPVKLKELEAEKRRLIEQYMQLQDAADEMNERIYHVCCEVEIVNQKIAREVEIERKKRAAAQSVSQHHNGQASSS